MREKPPRIEKWVYSPHALQRIEERKVSAQGLAAVITMPDHTTPQGPKWIFAKTIIGRKDNLIAAVLLEKKEHNLWVVVTVLVNFERK